MLGIVLFGLPSPLDVLDTGEAQVSTVESELSSRGSIPAILEKNSLLPPPDDGTRSTTFNDENESDSLRCAIEAEIHFNANRKTCMVKHDYLIRAINVSKMKKFSFEPDIVTSGVVLTKAKTIKRKRKKKNKKHVVDGAGSHLFRLIPLAEAVTDNRQNGRRCHVTKVFKTVRQVTRVTMIKPKVIYLLEMNLLEQLSFHDRMRGRKTSKKRRQARPKRWKLAYKAVNR